MMSGAAPFDLLPLGARLELQKMQQFQEASVRFLALLQLQKRLRLAHQRFHQHLACCGHRPGVNLGGALRIVLRGVKEMTEFDRAGRG